MLEILKNISLSLIYVAIASISILLIYSIVSEVLKRIINKLILNRLLDKMAKDLEKAVNKQEKQKDE